LHGAIARALAVNISHDIKQAILTLEFSNGDVAPLLHNTAEPSIYVSVVKNANWQVIVRAYS